MLCGCCLEVCPNYSGEGKFFGAVGMNACFRTAEQLSGSAKRERLSYFAKHGDAGCSKSLACQVVCPAKIPLSVVISRLNRERFLSVFYRNK
jgi:succinate dehydrogenase / fumarate reductase iron-sulfur subunit